MSPVKLTPSFREKVWGSTALEPWFSRPQQKIGEVWFEGGQPSPILIKFLFTSEKLSVQVHPPDNYARRHENSAGKTEMWHILRAGPGAEIALGFRERVTREQVKRAALAGEIEAMLNWIPVRAGDTYVAPAGTVHAIGAEVALCEIQQNSDVTYRLYDYGRPRELHLEKALEVADLGPHPGAAAVRKLSNNTDLLAHCEHFHTEVCVLDCPAECKVEGGEPHFLIFVEGEGQMPAGGFRAGEVWLVPAGTPAFEIQPKGSARMLRTYLPRS